jgi:hypothetical protein
MTYLRIAFTTVEKMKILTVTFIDDDRTSYSNNNSSIFLNIIEQKIVRLELIEKLVAKINVLYYASAATTAIAGILHLIQALNVLEFSLNFFIFFIISGIAQLFWVVPMIKRWGLPWYYIGIGGTMVLILLFARFWRELNCLLPQFSIGFRYNYGKRTCEQG